MISNYIKNICLISFALFGPVYLPAGGIQKDLSDYSMFNKSKEIILNSSTSFYCFPGTNSKRLGFINRGTSAVILREWINSHNDKWVRVQLSNNIFLNNNKPSKGWMKI